MAGLKIRLNELSNFEPKRSLSLTAYLAIIRVHHADAADVGIGFGLKELHQTER